MKKSESFIQLCKGYEVNPDLVPEILSFEDACAATGDDPAKLPIVDHLPPVHQKRLIADYKLCIIASALRNQRPPDYTNNEWKYFPIFEVEADNDHPSGSGLSYLGCGRWCAGSTVGVRHCFLEKDQATFFGKHFIELHKDHQLYT